MSTPNDATNGTDSTQSPAGESVTAKPAVDPTYFIGVDLDATLAQYDGWRGPLHIGDPIPRMVDLVKRLLAKGVTVKIFTARVADESDAAVQCPLIRDWTLKHIGVALEATAVKTKHCVHILDDRAVAIEPNTGDVLGWVHTFRGSVSEALAESIRES